jgi:hypothetical protein
MFKVEEVSERHDRWILDERSLSRNPAGYNRRYNYRVPSCKQFSRIAPGADSNPSSPTSRPTPHRPASDLRPGIGHRGDLADNEDGLKFADTKDTVGGSSGLEHRPQTRNMIRPLHTSPNNLICGARRRTRIESSTDSDKGKRNAGTVLTSEGV